MVVAIGEGAGRFAADGGAFRFDILTVLTFAGDLVGRAEPYVVPLPEAPSD